MKLGILFAGQGSQRVGMGRDFYDNYEDFRQVFDLLTEAQKTIAWEGPAEALNDTRNTQPIMVAFAAGVWALLRPVLDQAGVKPQLAAGLSLGEYSALHAAGVFTAEEAVELVELRASAMAKSAEGMDCAMKAVLQLDRETLADCCLHASSTTGKIVQMANFNCPGQIVIAGDHEAVEEAARLASEAGAKRCLPLPVSGPFHTSYMAPAGEALASKFDEMSRIVPLEQRMKQARFPVVHNATGLPLHDGTDGQSIAVLLVKQVQSSVYFEDSLRYMAEKGVDTFLEIGPGKALSGFVNKTCPGAAVYNISTSTDFDNVRQAVQQKGEL
ncbi:MAG: ACP S-malonyltransferase [Firmicutes bacterium]|nr:ACP S-malonyltransferase [Bacillota bacterium]